MNDDYSPGESDITATTLYKPARAVVLEKLHSDEIVQDVSEKLFILLGKAIHKILENADTEAIVEKRYYAEILGWKVGAQFDRLILKDGVLEDYKITSVFAMKDGGKVEYEWQMNIISFVLWKNGVEVKKAVINAILRDHVGYRARFESDYPPSAFMCVEVPLWTREKQEAFIVDRVRIHQNAKTVLPECTPAERWNSGDEYCLWKGSAKKAYRVVSSLEEAEKLHQKLGPEYRILFRAGKNRRCESYCAAAPFCNQFKKIKEDQENE